MSPRPTQFMRSTDGRLVELSHLPNSVSRRVDAVQARETSVPVIPDPNERAVVTAEEAFEYLGIDRSTGYKAIREGTFPIPIIRLGRVIRVPTAPLRRALYLDEAKPNGEVA
jgi:excisionase family DNA binding protein